MKRHIPKLYKQKHNVLSMGELTIKRTGNFYEQMMQVSQMDGQARN